MCRRNCGYRSVTINKGLHSETPYPLKDYLNPYLPDFKRI